MRFRDRTALTLCPLLARLALAVTFIYFGFGKFTDAQFSGRDAEILIQQGVVQAPAGYSPRSNTGQPPTDGDIPDTPEGDANSADEDSDTSDIRRPGDIGSPFARLQDSLQAGPLAAFLTQEEEEATATEDESEEQPAENPQEEAPDAEDQAGKSEDESSTVTGAPELSVTAHRYHSITVRLVNAGHPYPVWMARIAVVTETVGGILLVIGLFSRIWGLGLAVAMGYAFFLTTWQSLVAAATASSSTSSGIMFVWDAITSITQLPFPSQTSAFFQFALFWLALIVFFGGPGPLSLDHFIFGRRRRKTLVMGDEEEL